MENQEMMDGYLHYAINIQKRNNKNKMLKIKTYLEKSKLIPEAGIGLFADEDIKEGQIIWSKDEELDITFTEENFQLLDESQKEFFKKYCYKENGEYIFCIDNGRFLNHSEEINNTLEIYQKSIAKRNITKGEEIICNYKEMGTTKEDEECNISF